MAVEIILPKIGFSVNAMTLAEWLVRDGDAIKEGELLMVLESDKSVQEIESPATGVVRIQAEAGQSYEVGHVLGMIE